VVTPLQTSASSNPVDLGWIAVRTVRSGRELPDRIDFAGREAMVKGCGVTMAMPQGKAGRLTRRADHSERAHRRTDAPQPGARIAGMSVRFELAEHREVVPVDGTQFIACVE
jgi:hypothetical protein